MGHEDIPIEPRANPKRGVSWCIVHVELDFYQPLGFGFFLPGLCGLDQFFAILLNSFCKRVAIGGFG
jgi:hypothetical protein